MGRQQESATDRTRQRAPGEPGRSRSWWRGLALAGAALILGGCFSHAEREESDSESFWSEPAKTEAPSAPDYVVVSGDSLYAIAFRHGVDWRELARWNSIASPYVIFPGQHLRLASQDAPAHAAVESAPPSPPADAAGAESFAVREQPAAAKTVVGSPEHSTDAKHSAPPAPEPGAARTDAVGGGSLSNAVHGPVAPSRKPDAATAPTSRHETAVAAAPPLPAATAVEAERAPAATAPPAASAPQPAPERVASIAPGPSRAAAGLAWRWPARGTVVSRFLPGDPARQGINLQGKPGETVAAVADGDVVYSGNGLVGYGELIIVKHSAELLSAYGGSGKRLVTEGTKVKSGQALAEVAGNGIVHFEIRRAGKPVDPLEYLPQR